MLYWFASPHGFEGPRSLKHGGDLVVFEFNTRWPCVLGREPGRNLCAHRTHFVSQSAHSIASRRSLGRGRYQRNIPAFNGFRFVPTSAGQTGQRDTRDKRDTGQGCVVARQPQCVRLAFKRHGLPEECSFF